jgi:hypothetical protein
MAKITHDISTPNNGLGDALREAFENQNSMNTELYDTKVDKVSGKGLSANDFTDILKEKLDSMDLDAQVNVQADWFQEDNTADDYIKNKPDYLNSVGSFHYADLATQTTPLNVVANTPLLITNDTLGDETNVSNAPYGVPRLWSEDTNQFDFSSLAIGDLVTFNLDAYLTTSNTDQTYSYYLYFGIGSGNERVKYLSDSHKKPIGQLKYGGQVSFTIVNEDMRIYPAELYIISNHNASLVVNEFYFSVVRKNINVTQIEVDVADELAEKLTISNNLSDLEDATEARDSLGLGTLATQDGNFADKADDNAVVHLSGNETISGIKTFLTGMLALRNVANTFTSFFLNTNTAARTYTLQDRSGTLADDTDLALKANLANPTFTGSVVVPDGVEGDEAVNRGQLDAKASLESYSTVTADAYTFVLANANTEIFFTNTNTTPTLLTMPTNASVAFAIGTKIKVFRTATTSFMTLSGTGVDFLPYTGTAVSTINLPRGVSTLTKIDTNRWQVEYQPDFRFFGSSWIFTDVVNTVNFNVLSVSGAVLTPIVGGLTDTQFTFGDTANFNRIGGYTNTSGTKNALSSTITFNPTSGTGIFNLLNLSPIINQTGGANGKTRIIYFNPTLTNAVDFTVIEVANGKCIFQEVILQKPLKLAQYTVSTLPTGTQGDEAYVTDALTPTYLMPVVGGGAVVCKVFHNGSNWIT